MGIISSQIAKYCGCCTGMTTSNKDKLLDKYAAEMHKNSTKNIKKDNESKNDDNIDYTIPKATQEEQKIFNKTSKIKKEIRNKSSIILDKDSIKKKIETIKKATKITKEILSKKPSGDPGKKDTVLHVFNKMLGGNALMYDSSKGINCPDNEDIITNGRNMLRNICD